NAARRCTPNTTAAGCDRLTKTRHSCIIVSVPVCRAVRGRQPGRCGEIGRHEGLKIPFWRQSTGSTPVGGTANIKSEPFPKRRGSDFVILPPGRGGLLGVVLGLGVPELGVLAALVGQQLLVAAFLDHLTVVKDGDLVAELAGGEPVADVDGGLVAGDVVEPGVNFGLGDGVEGGGGL